MSIEDDDFIEPGKGIEYHVNKWMRENPKEYNNAFGQGLAYVKNRGMIQTEAGKKAFESALERWNNGNKIKLEEKDHPEITAWADGNWSVPYPVNKDTIHLFTDRVRKLWESESQEPIVVKGEDFKKPEL